MTLRFPEAIDNSMRKELVKCQKAAHWKFEKGLNLQESNEDLVAGGSFAKGVEMARRAFYEDGPMQGDDRAALEVGIAALYAEYGDFKCPPPKKYKTSKTAERMAGALAYYLGKNPMSEDRIKPFLLDGKLTVEMSFNYEIPISHPVTGKPLTYCGRYDKLGLDDENRVWVVDEKTTGQMGENWSNQWLLDAGLTGYCWAARKLLKDAGLDYEVAGAIINGVAIRALSNADPYEHMECPVFRSDWQLKRWFGQMIKDVQGWVQAYVDQDHNQIFDHVCALYNNPCAYAKLCNARNPEQLESSYVVKFWNPLARDNL